MKGLAGKSVLVTGGGGAIGAALCRRFAEERAPLLVADPAREAGERLPGECKGTALVFDIADYAAAKAALRERHVDVLVNNAGWDRFQNFADSKPGDWKS